MASLQQQGACDHTKLAKAQTLYRQSQQLLMNTMESYTNNNGVVATGNVLVDLLYMGLINNQAYISVEFSELEQTRDLFAQLIRFVLAVKSTSYSIYEPESQNQYYVQFLNQQVDKFLLNAALVGLCPTNAAPAA